MEKRAFLAVALMAAVLILYQTFLAPPPQETPPASPPQQQADRPATPAPTPAPATKPVEPAAPVAAAATTEPPPQRLARVTAPLYDAVISSEGGKLQEFTLKYRGEKPMVIVGDLGPAGLVIGPKDGTSGTVIPMQLSAEAAAAAPHKPTQELVLTGTHEGLRVRE